MSEASQTPREALDHVILHITNWLREDSYGEIDPANFEPRERASEGSGPDQVWFPCPRARFYSGDGTNPHQNRGGPDSYKSASDHRAYAYTSGGEIVLKCQLCTNGDHGDTLSPAEYKAEIIDELGIEIGNVAPLDGPVEVRRHAWPVKDGTLWHIKYKKTKRSRTAKWYWAYENAETGEFFSLKKFEEEKEHSAKYIFGHDVAEEAGFYTSVHSEQGPLALPNATMVFCEGEKDADMAQSLINIARAENRFVATAAAYNRISSGEELPGAFLTPFINRSVVSVFDRDLAGDDYRLHWPGAVWEVCNAWADVLLEVGEAHGDDPKFNDLSDWVEKMGGVSLDVANLFVRLLEEAQPITERPRSREHWMAFPSRSDNGKPHKADADNGRHLLKYHPALRHCIRRHAVTGDIVTVDAPFAPGAKVWKDPARLASNLSWWLTEQPGRYVLGERAFTKPMLKELALEAPLWSPHEEVIQMKWDGTGRAEQLFIDYIPLNCSEEQARALGRMVVADLARSIQGLPKPFSFKQLIIMLPRDLMGLSVARLIAPKLSASKINGNPKESGVIALMRSGARMIQYPAEAVTNFQNRRNSMEVLQASSFSISDGDDVGAPAFLFAGEMNRTDLSDVPPTYIVEDLRGQNITPVSDSQMEQMVAEAIARKAEWDMMPEPSSETTATEHAVRERFEMVGRMLAYYVFHKTDSDLDTNYVPLYNQVLTSPERSTPRARVLFADFRAAMHHYSRHVYGARYTERQMEHEVAAFFRWFLGKPDQKRFVVRVLPGAEKKRSGVLLEQSELLRLKTFLEETDDDEGGPERAGYTSSVPGTLAGTLAKQGEVAEIEEEKEVGTLGTLSQRAHGERVEYSTYVSVRAQARYIDKEVYPIEDLPADAQDARRMLAEAGPCGIDFETHPGDPEYWAEKEEQKYRAEPHKTPPAGYKTEIRKKKKYENAAPRREPCVMTLAKPGGREVWVRLPRGLTESRALLRAIFADLHPDIELIAHNATFESEVLAGAGIHPDIQCTMVASRLIYAEAFAWDDEDDDAPRIEYATGEEDVGIVNPDTGQLDLERLGPIGMPRYHSLAACMEREFGVKRDKTLRSIDWASERALEPAYVEYALEDAVNVLDLWEVYEAALKEIGIWEGYRVLIEALPAIGKINAGGLTVDMDRYDAYMDRLTAEVDAEREKLTAISGVKTAKKNMNDATKWWCVGQLWDGLLDHAGADADRFADIREQDLLEADWSGGTPVPRSVYWQVIRECIWDAGYEVSSTRGHRNQETDSYDMPDIGLDKSGLRKLVEFLDQTGVAPELLEYLRIYRVMNKSATLLSNLGDGFRRMIDPRTHRVTGHHVLAGAVTGRQACRDVNLQQVPVDGDARAMFVAPPGRGMIVADYSQVELRVGAVVAEDDALFQVYVNGEDVHSATASKCFNVVYDDVSKPQRKKAKAVNFGCLYGAAGPAISESALCSLAEGEALLASFLKAYPGIARYRERASHETGDIWIDPGRRVMATPEVQGPKRVNYPVQGGAASVQHRALKLVWDALIAEDLFDKAEIRAAIHDEIVVEYDLDVEERVLVVVKEAMTQALLDLYPSCLEMGYDRLVSIEAGHDWSEKA